MTDTLTRGPEQELPEATPEEVKAAAREARIDRVLDEADLAPYPDALAEETPKDVAGIDRMNDSADGANPETVKPKSALEVPEANILNLKRAQNEAERAKESRARQAVLRAQEEAGTLAYTKGQASESTTIDHPAPEVNSAGEPIVEIKPAKQKSRLGKWLEKKLGGGEN